MSGADYVWLISYAIVVLGLSAFGIHRYVMVYLFLKNSRNKPVPAGQFTELPLVTIQLPVFNEQHVVARLVDAVARLDYPQDRLQIQMLDDSTDETVEISRAQDGGTGRQPGSTPNSSTAPTAPATRRARSKTGCTPPRANYIFILDADFLPAAGNPAAR